MSGSATAAPAALVLERETELRRAELLLRRLAHGEGGLVLIEAAAGLGKTALLDAIVELATRQQLEICRARGTELEHAFAFGVARQWFEPTLAGLPAAARERALGGAATLARPALAATDLDRGGGASGSFSLLHGLYWLLAQLAGLAPMLLVVDDAHWADDPSLDWLDFLLNRIAGLPVLIIAASRPLHPGAGAGRARHALWHDPAVERLRLAPLRAGSVERLLELRLERPAEDEDDGEDQPDGPTAAFVSACHRASGGNPFLLEELLDMVVARGMPLTEAGAGEVAGLVSEDLVRRTSLRLTGLGDDATATAQALAALEQDGQVRRVAAVAGLDQARASVALDALIVSGLATAARPARIVHPLLRAAILDGLPPGRRSDLHARAAAVLLADGAEPERIAAHILECDPAAEVERVRVLRRAATATLGRGSPLGASRFLRRALEEPPARRDRAAVLRELGEAEQIGRHPDAITHLEEALALAGDDQTRAEIGLVLGLGRVYTGELQRALSILTETRDLLGDSGDPGLIARIEAQLIPLSGWDLSATAQPREELLARARDPTADERPLALTVACGLANAGDCDEVAMIVERGLAGGSFLARETSDSLNAAYACYALIFIDRLEQALALARAMRIDGRRRGSVLGVVAGAAHCALAELRLGALADAEADAQEAFELAGRHELEFTLPFIGAYLAVTQLERIGPEPALATLEAVHFEHNGARVLAAPMFLEARARVRLARGERAAAEDELRTCATATAADLNSMNPAVCSWRSLLSGVLAEDDPDEARGLAEEDLVWARRCGSARSEGIALRALARLAPRSERIAARRGAVTALRASPARLERAHALFELGSELLDQGRRAEARPQLLEALQLAHECGAAPLAEQALDRARAAGARPRRPASTGRDALTPAELRVARMAAKGHPNREIAQALFITTRTVKAHLTSSYRKLGITTRKDLSRTLAAPPG
ncbi:MAG TPA: AAA family ATPase [Solirubrobacterales bacterium]|jgi:DNA-binding CsgD family transcriptional regulator|nr:AAA family ATPase [Solirubrobacterales bacterium]